MGDKTAIEWTNATWNPVRGCSIVSKGCTNCYAMRQARRSDRPGGAYEGLTKLTKGGPVWNGNVRTVPELLDAPLRWRQPRRIFVNSMSDLFHESVPDEFIDQVFAVIRRANWHVFQILTKRGGRMARYLTSADVRKRIFIAGLKMPPCGYETLPPWPLPNVWLGVSVEDQASADERIPLLLQTPAAIRWISAEPLLGPIVLRDPPNDMGEPRFSYLERIDGTGPRIDWAVIGGESGPGSRPMHPDWARSLRDQCAAAGVPFFFKQWGTWFYEGDSSTRTVGRTRFFPDLHACFSRWSKRTTGRELDGRTHDEYPA